VGIDFGIQVIKGILQRLHEGLSTNEKTTCIKQEENWLRPTT